MAFEIGDVVVVDNKTSFYTSIKNGDIGIVSHHVLFASCFTDFGGDIGIREILPWDLRLATKLDKLLAGIENAD